MRDGPRVHVLPVEKIDYVQAQDDYVCFRCEGKEYLKEQTLAQVEASLDPAKFVRIHRSFVLNLDRLARVELDARENRIAILADGRRLPVSRAGYARLGAASLSAKLSRRTASSVPRLARLLTLPVCRGCGPEEIPGDDDEQDAVDRDDRGAPTRSRDSRSPGCRAACRRGTPPCRCS